MPPSFSRWFDQTRTDVRHAVRLLYRAPIFVASSVLALSLGIGANTAIFTLVHAVLLRPLPVSAPNELYSLGDTVYCCGTSALQERFTLYSYPLFQQVRAQTPAFTDIVAVKASPDTFAVRRTGDGAPARPFVGEFVSGGYFATLGVAPLIGRVLVPDDDRPGAHPVAVLSHEAWRREYGSAGSIVGSALLINRVPTTIVGIAPPGFFGATLRSDPPELWLPLAHEPAFDADNPLLPRPDIYWLYLIGRLKPTASVVATQAQITELIKRWVVDRGQSTFDLGQITRLQMTLTPIPGGIANLRSKYGNALQLLLLLSIVVLLIACGNIANLLLVRAMANRGQTALRVALGATRARLAKETLSEGLLVAALGGIAGVAIAQIAARALVALAFDAGSRIPINTSPSSAMLAFAMALSITTAAVFSVIPAWLAARTDPAEALRGVGRALVGQSMLSQRISLTIQAALSVGLIVVAGLLTKSLRNLEQQQLGFHTDNRLILRINPALDGYAPGQLPQLYTAFENRLPTIPGVREASYALHTPLDENDWRAIVSIDGRIVSPSAPPERAFFDRVSPHYFETIGTRLLRGRVIDAHDTPTGRHVAVINEAFAQKFLQNRDPIGAHFGSPDISHSKDLEVVGVVEDSKYVNERAPADPMFFLPVLQTERYTQSNLVTLQTISTYVDSIQLHAIGNPSAIAAAAEQTLHEIDPNLTVIKVLTLRDQVSARFSDTRLVATLSGSYAVFSLVLASIGLYAVVSYTVTLRSTDIGVRLALGARSSNIALLIVRSAVAPVAVGLVIGIPVAIAASRALVSELYGVSQYDPGILMFAVAALLVAALLAGLLPARRACTIDPVKCFRSV